MTVLKAKANGVELAYEQIGDPGDPPVLLIMGLGGQMVAWPDAFCEQFAGRGFYVTRYDNRDAGLFDPPDRGRDPGSRIPPAGRSAPSALSGGETWPTMPPPCSRRSRFHRRTWSACRWAG